MNKLFLSSCILLAFLGLSISAQTSKNAMEIGVTSDLLLSVNRFKTDIPELSESKEDELHWDNQFGDLYFNGPVYALAVCGTDLYIGGNFTSLNENPASYLAKWDGKTFTALGTGVNGPVYAIEAYGSDIYVGGEFSMAGDISANNIAKWDGAHWVAIGDGVNGRVNALAVTENCLYAGGTFTSAAGKPGSAYVARWHFMTGGWLSLGQGINNTVFALAVIGSDIYVGGEFTEVMGDSQSYLAYWREGSSGTTFGIWKFIEPGSYSISGKVYALETLGTDLFIGGQNSAGTYLTEYDGINLNPLGISSGPVYAISAYGNTVIIGGKFELYGDPCTINIVQWDGTNWLQMGYYTDNTINAIAGCGSDIFIGGFFWEVYGPTQSRYFARWMNPSVAPSRPATNIQFSDIEPTRMKVSWDNGNGKNRAVFILKGSTGESNPLNGTTYHANESFGSGDQIGATGWYCVYNGTGNNVSVTDLIPDNSYRVMVCEYNGNPGAEKYTYLVADGNPKTILLTTTGETDIGNLNGIDVYPIPVESFIKLDNVTLAKRITITNLSGSILMTVSDIMTNSITLQTADLKPGIYLLNIYGRQGEGRCVKIIKQ